MILSRPESNDARPKGSMFNFNQLKIDLTYLNNKINEHLHLCSLGLNSMQSPKSHFLCRFTLINPSFYFFGGKALNRPLAEWKNQQNETLLLDESAWWDISVFDHHGLHRWRPTLPFRPRQGPEAAQPGAGERRVDVRKGGSHGSEHSNLNFNWLDLSSPYSVTGR